MILIAKKALLHQGVEYEEGDQIPLSEVDVKTVACWVQEGSAILRKDALPPARQARHAAAMAGRTGIASGVRDVSGGDLAGRIPRRFPDV